MITVSLSRFPLILFSFLALSLVIPAADITDYKINPGDTIMVDVFGEKDLQKELIVSQSGEVTFPLLGSVRAQGLTAVQLQNKLKEDLGKDYLVDPQVTVQVKAYKRRSVSVYGQVGRPGIVDLPSDQPMTIIEAISAAGGFTRLSKTSDIQVTRKGKAQVYHFKEDDLRKQNDPDKVFYLQQGDYIYVPEAAF